MNQSLKHITASTTAANNHGHARRSQTREDIPRTTAARVHRCNGRNPPIDQHGVGFERADTRHLQQGGNAVFEIIRQHGLGHGGDAVFPNELLHVLVELVLQCQKLRPVAGDNMREKEQAAAGLETVGKRNQCLARGGIADEHENDRPPVAAVAAGVGELEQAETRDGKPDRSFAR